jgi:hypothetical protein
VTSEWATKPRGQTQFTPKLQLNETGQLKRERRRLKQREIALAKEREAALVLEPELEELAVLYGEQTELNRALDYRARNEQAGTDARREVDALRAQLTKSRRNVILASLEIAMALKGDVARDGVIRRDVVEDLDATIRSMLRPKVLAINGVYPRSEWAAGRLKCALCDGPLDPELDLEATYGTGVIGTHKTESCGASFRFELR